MKTHVPDVHARVIADAGFDASLVERAVADDSTLTEVRDEHLDAVARYGAHGVPTLVLDRDYAVYGPVVGARTRSATTRSRSGSSCGRCRGSRSSTSSGTRRRTDDLVSVAEHFRTYLTTRDWQTVENPAP